jgi:peptidoglycan/xylan/chitin deacetylase (PgdA/CDA1 family)
MKQISFLLIILILSVSGKPPSETESEAINDTKEVVCFVYHRFNDVRYPTTNTTVTDFEAHLTYLTRNNYKIMSFSDAIRYLQSEDAVKKIAVITIDDAYKTFFKNGLPVLKRYNVPATLFINTKTVGGGDYMTWAEIKIAAAAKIEIGNHTHTHNYFLNEAVATRYETFKEEIELSQDRITKNLGITSEVFSYPYGEFDEAMKKIVRQHGFIGAAAQNSGVIYAGSDVYQCPRFPMAEAYAAKEKFAEKAIMKALRVNQLSPESFIMPNNNQPLLTLTFNNHDLVLKRMQCFVQGAACTLRTIDSNDKETTVTVQASKKITSRRRTLYTLTIPDKNGTWYWYSHLWINAAAK